MEITALGIDVNSSTFYMLSQYVCRSLHSPQYLQFKLGSGGKNYISNPLINSFKFSGVPLRFTVTHVGHCGMSQLLPGADPTFPRATCNPVCFLASPGLKSREVDLFGPTKATAQGQ